MSKALDKLKQMSDNLENGMVLDSEEASHLIADLSDADLEEILRYCMNKKK